MIISTRKALLGCSAAVVALTLATQAFAQQRTFDIPAQDAATAIAQFGLQAGVQITAPTDQLRGVRTPALRGEMDARAALQTLLQGTGLVVARDDGQTIVLQRRPQVGGAPSPVTEIDDVVITGTRIRGANTPSPVIILGAEQIRQEGFSDLGEVVRSLPQNFSGGQNPGVALGASLGGVSNQNLTSGSALNLRGLGPDATVTLLNGRRLSYSGFVNGVDISVIPIAALDRIEVITDGASAIYGSDAVAGVGNIITRRDFDGVRADYQIAGATQGGGDESRYGLAAGKTWDSGGVIVAYEYSDIDAIFTHQRDYLDYMSGLTSLMPERSQHNLFASAHEAFGDNLQVRIDALYSRRNSLVSQTQGPVFYTHNAKGESFVIAPVVEFALPRDWSMSVGGSFAQDESVYEANYFQPAGVSQSRGCYCNTTSTFEVGGEGPAWTLPAGDVRVALGAGYRETDFSHDVYTPGSSISGRRSSEYAYGEVFVPLLAPEQGGRLDLTAAFRYENYDDFGQVTTPKVGLLYQPTRDFTLKVSWGESYKAPNLIQQYQANTVFLQPAAALGAIGQPADATALMISGGNPDLKPETAETRTLSALFHPRSVSGLQLELSLFDVDYTDRVILPVSNRTAAFRDPIYAPFVVLNPSADLQAEVIARGATGLVNAAPNPYDPTKVMGVLYAHYTNVARQRVQGVDLTGRYGLDLAGGRMSLQGSASWLEIQQRNSPVQADFETTGMVFNPPKFRARAGAAWQDDRFMLGAFVNHLDGVTNHLGATTESIGSFTTVDLNARYTVPGEGAFGGLELGLSVQNLLDRDPPFMTPMFDFVVNYDSTNYSGIGRFVRFSVSKRW